MNKDFALFQKEFKKWQRIFGLTGYKVYFKYEPLEKSFADIEINLEGMIATVRLNSKLPDKDKPYKNVRENAKHEAIHLLIGRLEMNGRYRFVSSGEMNESSEELVRKLEGLIA